MRPTSGHRMQRSFSGGRLVALAGVRDTCTMKRGPHLFVDDLVTAHSDRGNGHGTALLRWLAAEAAGRRFSRIYLDSRDTALGFYRQLGFQPMTSVPCIGVEQLVRRPPHG